MKKCMFLRSETMHAGEKHHLLGDFTLRNDMSGMDMLLLKARMYFYISTFLRLEGMVIEAGTK